MTVSEYLINPAGKGITAGNPKITREGYDIHYANIIKKLEKNKYRTQFYDSNDIIYVHIKVPSETVDDFFYDVVMELTATNTANTFNNFNIKFFSNSPSFVYTYAYVYDKNDLLIKELYGKYEDEVLSKKADIRNPIEYVGYEKSTYFALKYFLNFFNNVLSVKKIASTDINELIKNIKSNDEKKVERAFKRKATQRENEKKLEEKKKEKSIARKTNFNSKQTNISVILPKKSIGMGINGATNMIHKVDKIKGSNIKRKKK